MLYEEIIQISTFSVPVGILSVSKHSPVASWCVLYEWLTEKKKKDFGLVSDVSAHYTYTTRSDSCSITTPFWNNPERQSWRELSTVGWIVARVLISLHNKSPESDMGENAIIFPISDIGDIREVKEQNHSYLTSLLPSQQETEFLFFPPYHFLSC